MSKVQIKTSDNTLHIHVIKLIRRGLFSGPLDQVTTLRIILTIYIYSFIIFLTINPNPPCQLSMWEETGETRENPRFSAEC